MQIGNGGKQKALDITRGLKNIRKYQAEASQLQHKMFSLGAYRAHYSTDLNEKKPRAIWLSEGAWLHMELLEQALFRITVRCMARPFGRHRAIFRESVNP